MDAIIYAQVSRVLHHMTYDEVLAQRLALLLGTSHTGKYGYAKIVCLLSQDNDTAMHPDVAQAFLMLSGERLGV